MAYLDFLKKKELAAVDMSALKDAMSDLKDIAIKGSLSDDDFKSVAEDYGLNVTLLRNKFRDSYGTGENLRAVKDATDPKKHLSDKSDKTIDSLCRRYGVFRANTVEATYKGKPITLVCKTRGGSVIGVDHQDGRAYRWNPAAARSMNFKINSQSTKEEASFERAEESVEAGDREDAPGTYAAVWLTSQSAQRIIQYYKKSVQNLEPASELHSTTTYSRTPIKLAKHTFVIPLTALRYELFGEEKNVLVLVVDHPLLHALHKEGLDAGGSWDFPEYIPHITLSTKFTGTLEDLPPVPTFPIKAGRYTVEPIKD